jgi:hypothetical protein
VVEELNFPAAAAAGRGEVVDASICMWWWGMRGTPRGFSGFEFVSSAISTRCKLRASVMTPFGWPSCLVQPIGPSIHEPLIHPHYDELGDENRPIHARAAPFVAGHDDVRLVFKGPASGIRRHAPEVRYLHHGDVTLAVTSLTEELSYLGEQSLLQEARVKIKKVAYATFRIMQFVSFL